VDERDYTAMRTCLTDEVAFDYMALFGTIMPTTADQLVENVRNNHRGFRATQHITTNHYVTVDGDRAKVAVPTFKHSISYRTTEVATCGR
jgi:hypothetical protein